MGYTNQAFNQNPKDSPTKNETGQIKTSLEDMLKEGPKGREISERTV